MKLIYI